MSEVLTACLTGVMLFFTVREQASLGTRDVCEAGNSASEHHPVIVVVRICPSSTTLAPKAFHMKPGVIFVFSRLRPIPTSLQPAMFRLI
eukprot:scaffold202924_cov15-Prasinocladus_malaysianus.AAC.1